jgi:serine/threonine protein phosphatase PrpC
LHLAFWGATDVGCVRKRNEDHFVVDPDLGLAVVADGIGGQHRGDVAAALACRVVREHLDRHRSDLEGFRREPSLVRRHRLEERLREALQAANQEVWLCGEATSRGRGMGCTMEAAVVQNGVAFLAHVGDARTYLVRGKEARQLTEDHTVVQEKVRRGLMTPEQAAKSPGKNVITRAIGNLPTVRVDQMALPFGSGDRLLLCSDGVTRYVGHFELPQLLGPGDARSVEDVVEISRSRGGVDNITAVMVIASAEPPAQAVVTQAQLDELRATSLFESATLRELRLVASIAERRDEKAGKLLFREGQAGSEMFVLVEGEVVITRGGQHLATLGPGCAFGEMALLDAPQRSASALVTQNATLLVLSRHRFDQLMRQDDGVAARLMWGLLQRLSAVVRTQNDRLTR